MQSIFSTLQVLNFNQCIIILQKFESLKSPCIKLKPSLHEPQLPVEWSVTLIFSVVLERRRCALQVISVARLQENKET